MVLLYFKIMLREWFGKEKGTILQAEARSKIRIEDYGDEICLTIEGIKARSVTDVAEAINELKELRDEYVRKHLH